MKLSSEQKKALYEHLEKNEELKAIIEPLKEDLVTAGRVESDLEKVSNKLKEYEGVDIAALRASAKFVEDNGGTEKILDLKAKAGGYEEDIQRREAEKKQAEQDLLKYKTESEEYQKKVARAELVNKTLPAFMEHFELPELVQSNAIDSGYVFYGENGAMVKVGDVVKPLDASSMDMLKTIPEYKGGAKSPSGTGGNLGAPEQENNNKGGSGWYLPKKG